MIKTLCTNTVKLLFFSYHLIFVSSDNIETIKDYKVQATWRVVEEEKKTVYIID